MPERRGFICEFKRAVMASATKHAGAVDAVAMSGDAGRAISGGRDQTAIIWNSNGTQVGDALVHDSEVLSVALSDDGNLALTGTGNGMAWLWDVQTGKLEGNCCVTGSTTV